MVLGIHIELEIAIVNTAPRAGGRDFMSLSNAMQLSRCAGGGPGGRMLEGARAPSFSLLLSSLVLVLP